VRLLLRLRDVREEGALASDSCRICVDRGTHSRNQIKQGATHAWGDGFDPDRFHGRAGSPEQSVRYLPPAIKQSVDWRSGVAEKGEGKGEDMLVGAKEIGKCGWFFFGS
jgi:hypothetical protein